jgi:hypothetical protein
VHAHTHRHLKQVQVPNQSFVSDFGCAWSGACEARNRVTHQSDWAVGRVCGWPAGKEPPAAGSGIDAGSGEDAGHSMASTTWTHDAHTWKLLTMRAGLSRRPATVTCHTIVDMSAHSLLSSYADKGIEGKDFNRSHAHKALHSALGCADNTASNDALYSIQMNAESRDRSTRTAIHPTRGLMPFRAISVQHVSGFVPRCCGGQQALQSAGRSGWSSLPQKAAWVRTPG